MTGHFLLDTVEEMMKTGGLEQRPEAINWKYCCSEPMMLAMFAFKGSPKNRMLKLLKYVASPMQTILASKHLDAIIWTQSQMGHMGGPHG